MKLKKNGFYLIKNEFFEKMRDPSLPMQKSGRPVYYCISDRNNKDILWAIPMTTKLDKVKKIIEKFGGVDKCNIYYINPTEKNSVFNIQDIFPTTVNYIEREYKKEGEHYTLKNIALINEIEKRAKVLINNKMLRKKLIKNEIDVQKIYQTLETELRKEKVEKLVKEVINNGIDENNYNVLTGNEILTQNHSSGDKRWIAMTDIRANNITIKNNQKPTLTIVLHDENGKLYAMPIEYYNVSQLNITKELEQKFVPMKEKEKSVEKSKDKGIER